MGKRKMLDSINPPKKTRFRFWFALVMFGLLAAGIFIGTKLVLVAQRVLEGGGVRTSLKQFFLAQDTPLAGEAEEEIRILLLGIAGEGHDGGTLTDTMILATIKVPKNGEDTKVGLVSIPRDLVVNIPGYDFRKINSAYAYGGAKLARESAEELLGFSIPYYAVVDFDGFKQIINDLGGVEISVEEGFTDSLYPDEKGGYLPPIIFETGRQHMEGERALQFVRSRHGSGNEGTDFARSKRQQLVLRAVKDKLAGMRVLANLGLLGRLLDEFSKHLRTNLAPHELKRIYDLVRNIGKQDIRALAINHEGALVCDQIAEDTGAYLLVPCAGLGQYTAIRNLVKNQFLVSDISEESPVIEIQNAAHIDLLAQRVQQFLNLPYLKISIGNFRAAAAFDQTTIYDNTGGGKKRSLSYLQKKLGAAIARSPFPFPTTAKSADFVIILAPDMAAKLP